MKAESELGRICQEEQINNSQVLCITDALVEYVDEKFAERFVNKKLEDADIRSVESFPKYFNLDKFISVNKVWRLQKWGAKHRLVDRSNVTDSKKGADPFASGMNVKTANGSLLSHAEMRKLQKEKKELEERLSRAESEYASSMQKLKQASASLQTVQEENAGLKENVFSLTKELKLKSENLEVSIKELESVKQKSVQLESELAVKISQLGSLHAIFPNDVVITGYKLAQALPSSIDARRVNYLYLSLVSSNQIDETAFAARFKFFDDELYALLMDDETVLAHVRAIIAADLNPRLANLQVTWDIVGAPYDSDKYATLDTEGIEVVKVLSALITKKNGAVVRRAQVKTSKY